MREPNTKPRTARAIGVVQRTQTVTPHMQRITLRGLRLWISWRLMASTRRLHGADTDSGPAAAWAARASIGERIGVAGPSSGGFQLPGDARWVMLAGDATALPGIQSIASRLPAGINAKAYVEVVSNEDRQPIDSFANLREQWMNAQLEAGLTLCQSLLHRPLPAGPGYIWMVGESAAIRKQKLHYLQERELPRNSVSTKGYWKLGEADHRET